ncbi:MAG: type IV pilus assembly protein PilM [Candidatus Daviesbacteria bacterium]|nr:MAG: type IV pilus assembly protein PilM [Candidatus Daviesbacteria bacterium]
MAKISIGLDIGFTSIKVVALDLSAKLPKVISFGSIVSPQPGISSEADIELEAVATAIKNLLQAAKIEGNEVTIALPESKIFTRVIDDLPPLTDKELASAITFAAEEFIPLPVSELSLNYQVLSRSKEKTSKTVVLVVGSPTGLINKYIKVLNLSNLKPKAIETEIIAAARSLVGNNPLSPTTLILQMGASTTDFAAVSHGMIWQTRSIATGGLALTRALAAHLNFELPQAEEYKKTYGLVQDALAGKVFEGLKPVADIIVGETRRVIQSYETKYPQDKIKRVILSGGGSKLPGFVIYFANNLGVEVQDGDPWAMLAKEPALSAKLASAGSLYTVAVGLALREQ